jgi:hypothetical protein
MVTAKGVLVQSGGAGATQVITPTGFSAGEPIRAILFFAGYATAAGTQDADGILSIGWATNDGGSIQQGYLSYFDDDVVGTADTAAGCDTTAALKWFNAGTPVVDGEMDVTTFTDTAVTVTWTDPPTSAVRIHWLAIGGSDVAQALAFTFTTGTATGDVDVTAPGFQPDLCFLLSRGSSTSGDAAANCFAGMSAFNRAGQSRATVYMSQDTGTTMILQSAQRAKALLMVGTPGGVPTVRNEATVTADSSWPAGGFRLNYTTSTTTSVYIGLALRGTFTSTIGAALALTAGSTQNLAHSVPPKGAIFWGNNMPVSAALDTGSGDLGGFFIGAADGTNQGSNSVGNDDGNTASMSGRAHSETKAIQNFIYPTPTAVPTLQSEAGVTFSGNNVVETWNDLDTVAREHSYVILGSAAAASSLPPALPFRMTSNLYGR